jgi:hypothetical protein
MDDLRPNRNSIQNYDWRQDRPVNLTEIRFTVSQTLWLRTYRGLKVFQLLDARNRF